MTSVDGTQPRFSQPHYWARVAESAERRTPVITLEAAAPSPASTLESALVFQLTSTEQPALFDVDFTTGGLRAACGVDFTTGMLREVTGVVCRALFKIFTSFMECMESKILNKAAV